MFTFLLSIILIIIKNANSLPAMVTRHMSMFNGPWSSGYSFKSLDPTDQILLRVAVLLIGILILITFPVCQSAMYWCASLVSHCSSAFTASPFRSDGVFWNRLFSRGIQKSREGTREEKDLPPSYEIVIAYKKDDLAVSMKAEEKPPPSYSEALTANFGAA